MAAPIAALVWRSMSRGDELQSPHFKTGPNQKPRHYRGLKYDVALNITS